MHQLKEKYYKKQKHKKEQQYSTPYLINMKNNQRLIRLPFVANVTSYLVTLIRTRQNLYLIYPI